MFTIMPPSALWHRMKRSPKTRTSSPRFLKAKASTYHSAVFRGSGAFRWMWLIRYAMDASCGDVESAHCRGPTPRLSRPRRERGATAEPPAGYTVTATGAPRAGAAAVDGSLGRERPRIPRGGHDERAEPTRLHPMTPPAPEVVTSFVIPDMFTRVARGQPIDDVM